MISIIEQSSISKTGIPSNNEDGLYISDKYIAVIDGATSKETKLYNGLTGGQVVRDIIINSLNCLNADETFYSGVKTIQSDVEKQFPADKYFHASASAAIFSVKNHCIWMIGDCQAMVNRRKITNNKIVDDLLSKTRAMVLESLIMDGTAESDIAQNDIGREMIMPFLKLQQKFENKSSYFGYLTFNNIEMTDEALKSKGMIIDVPANSEVILASDGYPCLMDSLSASENELERLINLDPLCYKINYSTKGIVKGNISYDDRTYVRFKI